MTSAAERYSAFRHRSFGECWGSSSCLGSSTLPLAARSMLWLDRYHRQEHARISGYEQFVDDRWSHESGWSGAIYSSDGQRVYTHAPFGSLQAWNAHSGVAAPQDMGVSLTDTIKVGISGDGQRIACIPVNSHATGKIIVYDRSGRLVAEISRRRSPGRPFTRIHSALFSRRRPN